MVTGRPTVMAMVDIRKSPRSDTAGTVQARVPRCAGDQPARVAAVTAVEARPAGGASATPLNDQTWSEGLAMTPEASAPRIRPLTGATPATPEPMLT